MSENTTNAARPIPPVSVPLDIRPFRSVTECPKCGEPVEEPNRVYCTRPRHFSLDAWPFRPPGPEHLDVECGSCGYTWYEACADAGEQAPASDYLAGIEEAYSLAEAAIQATRENVPERTGEFVLAALGGLLERAQREGRPLAAKAEE